jgi:hypothetical protein
MSFIFSSRKGGHIETEWAGTQEIKDTTKQLQLCEGQSIGKHTSTKFK